MTSALTDVVSNEGGQVRFVPVNRTRLPEL